MVETQLCKLRGTSDTFLYDTEYGFCGLKAPSYRVAKNLFSEIKNQDQKPINAKICFFSPIEHVVGTRAIFQNQQLFTKSTAADKKSWKGTWEVTSRTPVECMLCCMFAQARRLAPRATRAQPDTQPDTQRLVLALRRTRHTRQLCSCCCLLYTSPSPRD